MSYVADNSLTMSWCFQDERTPAVMDLFGRMRRSGAVVPQIWPLEAVNSLLMAQRRGRITLAERLQLTALLHALPIEIDPQTIPQLWTTTALLAQTHRLSAYDAAYLELAIRLGLPLATRDRALGQAARDCGVESLLD